MTLTKALAEYIDQTRFEDLPEAVVEFTKICILDWYGSAVAGKDEPPIQAIKELIEEWGGHEQASLVTGGKSSIGNAMLVNAASSHIVELDDIHKASIIHAGTVVIPAAVAVAEAYNLSGKDLITAVVVGYEVCYRIGEAVSPSHYYFWHNTATCGTFGSAAAVAKLLNLNIEQTIYALGNAGSQAAGLWEFIEDGANTKQLHTAKAAYNGTLAAVLAKKNFTGATRILEGRRGFFESMSEAADPSKITENLGREFKITENSFKIHASCRHTHPAIDCVLDIMNEHHISYQSIKKITVNTYQTVLNITDNPNPGTVYASKFSSQFCASLAAVKGSASLRDFTNESLKNPEIVELMGKVEVKVDPYYEEAYPEKWGAKVEVKLEDGRVFSKATDYPKGDPEKTASKEELIEKFIAMTSDKLENPREEVEAIFKLEEIKTRELFSRKVIGG
ncbi:MmgE/PrpD family protein [Neobacillus terrae]|uniref:MmgE/PrpD family protein n=1 Tax=Neobacillus terrae TaxID=3034837 RepID=UPI00140BB47A|nr:MmgE/PrpD family protein [Neobacillus terrae]NHM31413.1 MmgE/PrpD family protein [Neobacillus terrae]